MNTLQSPLRSARNFAPKEFVFSFLSFTIAEIPHLTWGGELTLDYQQRARVFGVRFVMTRIGIVAFYAMPLLPLYASTDYTP